MKTNIVITTKEGTDVKKFVKTLIDEGISITDFYNYGVIFGKIDEDNINVLSDYDEILDFKQEQTLTIPSPDSEIQ